MLENILHKRIGLGKDGVPFTYYKIRTMILDAEDKYKELAEQNGLDGIGKVVDDPRITNWGRYLRRCGIDEFPQLYNVIKGDMSLVGLRPRTELDWEMLPAEHKERALKFKPGFVPPAYTKKHIEGTDELIEIEKSIP
jgi:lipopolysaccharide/colanic/teichoic acid biosynthesis glycosyltransferase